MDFNAKAHVFKDWQLSHFGQKAEKKQPVVVHLFRTVAGRRIFAPFPRNEHVEACRVGRGAVVRRRCRPGDERGRFDSYWIPFDFHPDRRLDQRVVRSRPET